MKRQLITTFGITLFLAISCGKNETRKVEAIARKEMLETDMDGIYLSKLLPVNKNIATKVTGSVTAVREQDDFIADVRLARAPGSSTHFQSIHSGDRCPDERDDTNLDGVIDGVEAKQAVGKILIPLDNDLSSQWIGLEKFPVSDEFGNYLWSRKTSFSKMLQDLKEEDINLLDDYGKVSPENAFSVKGLVAVIYGIPEVTKLPQSTLENGRLTRAAAIPIACGVFRKVEASPGRIESDERDIPLPKGDYIGGSDGPDDGAIFLRNGSTTGGNYGDDHEPL